MTTSERAITARDALVDWLVDRIATYLATTADAVDTDMAFGDFGLDSAFALSLCTDLEAEFGILAEPTVTWDYPTIDAVAEHLAEELAEVTHG